MTMKSFEIQSKSLSLNGVVIDTSAQGKLVIPGITRAGTSVAIEVNDTGDQSYVWNAIPDVIDGYTYEVYVTGNQPGLIDWQAATYAVDQLDGDGYIDGISVVSGGNNYTGEAVTFSTVMYAAPSGTPVDSSSNNGTWVQVPFLVRCGAGEIQSEFGTGATALEQLSDVNISDVQNGQVLVYSDSDGNWINQSPSGGTNTGNISFDGDTIKNDNTGHIEVTASQGNYAALYENDQNTYIWVQSGQAGVEVADSNGDSYDFYFQYDNANNKPVLQLPQGGDIVNSDGISVLGGSGASTGNILFDGTSIYNDSNGNDSVDIYTNNTPGYAEVWLKDNNEVYITADGEQTSWSFQKGGNLRFPDNTIQTTAYTGGGGTGSVQDVYNVAFKHNIINFNSNDNSITVAGDITYQINDADHINIDVYPPERVLTVLSVNYDNNSNTTTIALVSEEYLVDQSTGSQHLLIVNRVTNPSSITFDYGFAMANVNGDALVSYTNSGANTGDILFDANRIYIDNTNDDLLVDGGLEGVNILSQSYTQLNYASSGLPNSNEGQNSYVWADSDGVTVQLWADVNNGDFNHKWEFKTNGDLTVPGKISPTSSSNFYFTSGITNVSLDGTQVYVDLADSVFGGPVSGTVNISGVLGIIQINNTWYYTATNENQFTLYTDNTYSTPVDGSSWAAYASGGVATSNTPSIGFFDGGVNVTNSAGGTWEFGSTGSLQLPGPAAGTSSFTRIRGGDAFVNFDVQYGSLNDVYGGARFGTNNTNPVDIITDFTGSTNTWRFGTDGNLTLPNNGSITASTSSDSVYSVNVNPDGINFVWDAEDAFNLSKGPGGGSINGAANKSIYISTNDGNDGQNGWEFTTRGKISFPDGTEQSTAYIKQNISLDGGGASVQYDTEVAFIDGGFSSTRHGVVDPTFDGGNTLTEMNELNLDGGKA